VEKFDMEIGQKNIDKNRTVNSEDEYWLGRHTDRYKLSREN
jgi:hypothetical protein